MDCEEVQNEIGQKYNEIKERAVIAAKKAGRSPEEVKVLSVSKTQPARTVECAYSAGLRCFGENYVQEMSDKFDILKNKGIDDIEWHFIGHLQSNKVRFLSPFVNFIHSVDTFKLANEIDKRAESEGRIVNCLLQINTSGEISKSGCDPDDAENLMGSIIKLNSIRVVGLMTIGTFTNDEYLQRKEFRLLRNTLDNINKSFGLKLNQLSMGMTGDFEVAIDEGATMVRIGTAIFGERHYRNFG
ncbi:MAG: YggS family pyridoxal phosphate-dependent enzyme [Candidatus Kapabacteria bacterium]|nr:YggS family pyridoxal phosphate-dependent enzyme [Ignavibacteriota bacterium]MCW5883954.1 YggS family pyridoxal phosphate-dependent enzyme [Candidatus Kapabacteria bacterium]